MILRGNLSSAGRSRDARRAAFVCGAFIGLLMAWNAAGNGSPAFGAGFAALFWGAIAAAAGAAAVYAGAAWRAENGRWHVSPTFAALAAGTPTAALAGGLTLGTPLSGWGAAMTAAAWICVVLVLRFALRVRAGRRDRFA